MRQNTSTIIVIAFFAVLMRQNGRLRKKIYTCEPASPRIARPCSAMPAMPAMPRNASIAAMPASPRIAPHRPPVLASPRIAHQWSSLRAPTRGAPTIVAGRCTMMCAMSRHVPPCPAMPGIARYRPASPRNAHNARNAPIAPQCEHCSNAPIARIAPHRPASPASPRITLPCPHRHTSPHIAPHCASMVFAAGDHEGRPYDRCRTMQGDVRNICIAI